MDFYFDFLSPYAYFAWLQTADFCDEHNLTLNPVPVPFAGLLNHWGHLGPAEIPTKREFTFRNVLSYAKRNDIPLLGPKNHPFHPIASLRAAVAEASGNDQFAVIDAIFKAGWSNGADLGDLAVLTDILNKRGLDGSAIMARTKTPDVKAALKANFDSAIERGVFGVPTMFVDGLLFWGNDQFVDIVNHIQNGPVYSEAELSTFLAIQPAAIRK